ncbi:MAG: polysaccharide biosynthesis/export family protein [Verrucomicrobia bacterium]|nr:polysaccharide biosynthesis/export family protein [Verrucomicrobiota bacterium]
MPTNLRAVVAAVAAAKLRRRPLLFLAAGCAALLFPAAAELRAQDRFSSMPPPPSSYGGNRSLFDSNRGAAGNNGAAANPGNYGNQQMMPGAPAAQPVDNGGSSAVVLDNVGPDYRLHRGDRLSYQVKEDRDPVTKLFVTDSGEIEVPYLDRRLNALGKTCGELQREVKSALERDLYVHATVQLGLDGVAPRASKGRVYITGAVHVPGPVEIPYDETLTVSRAVIRAGNFKDFADRGKVKILRQGSKPIIVNVKEVLAGKIERDVELQPGDTVLVPEKWINFGM